MRPLLLLAGFVLVGLLIGRAAGTRGTSQEFPATPADLPRGDVEILEAVPFVTDEPFVHEWRAEKPLATAGVLLVLRADPALVRTRETYEPVLYAGAQTAERCALPNEGDVMIALVPAPLDSDGRVALDLATTPIWFGGLELPERVDAARIARELAAARARGIGPARRAARVRASFAPDDAVRVRDRYELEPYVGELAARHR